MEEKDILSIVKKLKNKKIECISKDLIPEKDLLLIANHLKNDEEKTLDDLLAIYTNHQVNFNCDWNIGSIIQHFDYNKIIAALKKIPINKRAYLYDSIGLSWMLGECPYKNEYVIDFLYEILNYSRNSEAWWRAAFALEKMTGKNAINNLKRSLKNKSIPTLDECFENLSDKKSVVGILLNSNSMVIKDEIYPRLKQKFEMNKEDKMNNKF